MEETSTGFKVVAVQPIDLADIPDSLKLSVKPLFEQAKSSKEVSVIAIFKMTMLAGPANMSANIFSLGEFDFAEVVDLGTSVAGRSDEFISILNKE
jgi:hypothetical protein